MSLVDLGANLTGSVLNTAFACDSNKISFIFWPYFAVNNEAEEIMRQDWHVDGITKSHA
jgi:hypothetical protein